MRAQAKSDSETLQAKDLIGCTLRLCKPNGEPFSLTWLVRACYSGSIVYSANGDNRPSSIVWPELRRLINAGYIQVEGE
jgi:hypothetical protein